MISKDDIHVQNTANAVGNKISDNISGHNNSNTAHADIREQISDLNALIGDAIQYING